MTTDSRYKHYKANQDSIVLKDGLLIRKIFEETSSFKYYQVLIPKQVIEKVLEATQEIPKQ